MEQQRSKAWHQKRVGKITGSRVGAILGLNPWSKPADAMRAMVREYHGAESEFKGNIATEYGTRFESYAQADFEIESGLDVAETGFHAHPFHDWLGASPDGLVGSDAVLEIKCPYGKRTALSHDFESYTKQPHYYAQMQIEMYCTGRKKCHFYQWSEAGSKMETVDFSKEWIDTNIPKLKAFYEKYLKEIDNEAHLVDLVQTREAQHLADEYTAAKAAMDEAKARLDEAKAKLVEAAEGKKTNISGLLVYPIKRAGSISYAKVVKEHCPDVDLEPYRGKKTESWGIK